MFSYDTLPPFDEESGELNAVIETPKNSRNKYDYDPKLKVFKLGGALPIGYAFPFDFGFVPDTLGGDGDPLDVLILMDEPVFTGCLVKARLIGVIEGEQTERAGEIVRNDRLIAVASDSRVYADAKSLDDLSEKLIAGIEDFFVFYNEAKGKTFKVLGRFGKRKARTLIERGIKLRAENQ